MIMLAKELGEAIETYNNSKEESKHLDYWEVVDEINDPADEQEVKEAIETILENI